MKIYGIAAVGAAVFGAVLWWSAEPSYKGQSLSEWLEYLRGTPPNEPPDDEGVKAVRHIGKRAVPTLLKMLSTEQPKWKKTTDEWAERIGLSFGHRSERTRAQDALRGFRILGPDADSAVPELRQMLSNSNTGPWAAIALGEIGPHTAPILLAAVTNGTPDVRRSAVYALASFPSTCLGLREQMWSLRSDADQSVAGTAVSWTLKNTTGSQRGQVLRETLQEGRRLPMATALYSLRRHINDPAWSNVLPELIQLLNSTNGTIRSRTTNWLIALDPTIAASVGVNTSLPPPRTNGPGSGRFGRGPSQ